MIVCHLVAKGFVFNKDQQLIKSFVHDKAELDGLILGGTITNGKVVYLLGRRLNDDQFFKYSHDIREDRFTKSVVELEGRKSLFLASISLGDQFLFMTAKKNDDMLHVKRIVGDGAVENLELPMPPAFLNGYRFYDILLNEYDVTAEAELSYMGDWKYPSGEKLKARYKLYFQNDSLFLLRDRAHTVEIVAYDLKTISSRSWTIDRKLDACDGEPAGASHLLGSLLFSTVACKNEIRLIIYDFYSGKELKQRTTREGEMSFFNSPIIVEGAANSALDNKDEKTKQLWRKMMSGRPIIFGSYIDSNTIELTIGSYKHIFFSNNYEKTGETMSFKSLTDVSSLDHKPGIIENHLQKTLKGYAKKYKIPDQCEGIFPSGTNQVYYFLDRKSGKLFLVGL